MRNATRATTARSRLITAARRATPAVVQPMERRMLMSTVALANGVLTVTGTSGADYINVEPMAGSTNIYLGTSVSSTTEQTLTGNLTSIVVNAGDGNDTVFVDANSNGSIMTTLKSISISGGSGDDDLTLFDYSSAATIDGGDGNDSIDSFAGTGCNVLVTGDAGNDSITADGGTTSINGGDGDDLIVSDEFGEGAQTIAGGAGTDTLDIDPSPIVTGPLSVNLDGQNDSGTAAHPETLDADIETLDVSGIAGSNLSVSGDAADNTINVYLFAGEGATVHGGDGDDALLVNGPASTTAVVPVYLYGDAGNDTLSSSHGNAYFSGGAGTDTVDYSGVVNATVYMDGSNPSGSASQITDGNGDHFDGTVEQVIGGAGNDLMYAAPGGGDQLDGNDGNDTLVAQGGADALFGGAGADLLEAADGGPTFIDGGDGTDTAYVDATGDTTVNVENVIRPTSGATVRLTGTTSGTAGSYANGGNTVAKATDGDLTTYFDGPTANGNVVTVDLGSAQAVTQIGFAPRSGWAGRMVGGVFQASTTADFSSGVVNVYTVTAAPTVGTLTKVATPNSVPYRYWRYVSPNGSYGDIAEFELFGPSTSTTSVQLTGTTYGTTGSYANGGNTVAMATDGSVNTYFDGPTANGDTVDIDLGSAKTVGQIKYAPRAGWAARMVGGVFQASSTADFSSGVVNVYTVTATPTVGVLTTVTPSTTAAYRYWRYVAPNGSYGDIAEFQLFGPSTGTVLAARTGTTIGTAGSFQGRGNTIANATDGSLTTFFDGPTANGDWVGLDLGSAQSVSTISYAPRAGWESRMLGGIFQASNTADFSSGVVNLYTITTTPPSASLTTVTLATPVTYRYYRYLAPTGSYGDIAEFQLFGN